MKKISLCMMAAAAAMLMSVTAFAATEYDVEKNAVTVDADGKQTVLITRQTSDGGSLTGEDIYYVGQAERGSTYKTASEFLLKADAPDGAYTITLGGDGSEAEKQTFYIGMSEAAGDVELKELTGSGASSTNADGTKNIGYSAADISGTFTGVIIKMDDKYYGARLGELKAITVSGASVGIQINGVGEETIQGVWLTGRNFDTQPTETE